MNASFPCYLQKWAQLPEVKQNPSPWSGGCLHWCGCATTTWVPPFSIINSLLVSVSWAWAGAQKTQITTRFTHQHQQQWKRGRKRETNKKESVTGNRQELLIPMDLLSPPHTQTHTDSYTTDSRLCFYVCASVAWVGATSRRHVPIWQVRRPKLRLPTEARRL